MGGYISGLSSVFRVSVFMPVSHCFDFCSFVVSSDARKCESSTFVFQDGFGYLKSLETPCKS